MFYPNKLSERPTIGVTAMSAGQGKYIDKYKKSILNLENNGFQVIETASVRNDTNPSNTPDVRAKELDRVVTDSDVELVMCASGGDFLFDMIPHVDFENIKNNPKWYMGSSDPSSLLHIITTKLDMATIYGFNAASFDRDTLHKSELNAIEIMKGNIIPQESFEKYELEKDEFLGTYNLTKDVYWENINEENITIKGRIIGGCIDAIKNILGTKYDYTKDFIERYKEDGIIWYFDIFSLTAEDLYLLLIQMREAGWLDYLKGVIVGRVKYPNSFVEMTYQDALRKVLDVPVIFNADIGHVAPKMTIINGSIATITSSNGKGTITQELI